MPKIIQLYRTHNCSAGFNQEPIVVPRQLSFIYSYQVVVWENIMLCGHLHGILTLCGVLELGLLH